ncbi:hypothetical protein ACFU99_03655 [Streptomyces sp. NPDC057654]|uniref:hypothetical protein n=1 Tax=Streptomyces sp. NPDC057654 TaxID=3346196 RepID=UPI003695D604
MQQQPTTTHRLTIDLPDDEWEALRDLADARGAEPGELARESVRRLVDLEESLTRADAMRLATRHADLLRRLGQ